MSPKQAPIFWMTGLSGAGKTTLVNAAIRELSAEGYRIKVLDGDVVRLEVNPHLGFTPEDIRENNRIIATLCLEHRPHHDLLFVPVITPFEDIRNEIRKRIGEGFFLIYLKTSLQTVMQRDVKGLYQKALKKEIDHVIGFDERVPFQEPTHPDLVIHTEKEMLTESTDCFLTFIRKVLD